MSSTYNDAIDQMISTLKAMKTCKIKAPAPKKAASAVSVGDKTVVSKYASNAKRAVHLDTIRIVLGLVKGFNPKTTESQASFRTYLEKKATLAKMQVMLAQFGCKGPQGNKADALVSIMAFLG